MQPTGLEAHRLCRRASTTYVFAPIYSRVPEPRCLFPARLLFVGFLRYVASLFGWEDNLQRELAYSDLLWFLVHTILNTPSRLRPLCCFRFSPGVIATMSRSY